MSFTARLKTNRQLFDVTTDLGTDGTLWRNACLPLRGDAIYAGHLFNAYPTSGYEPVKFTEFESAVFRGDELEEFSVVIQPLRLRDRRRRDDKP